jgi:hypothetical protein
LGGVKIGNNLQIDSNGTLNAVYSYKLPIATATTLGGVIVDPTISGIAILPSTGFIYLTPPTTTNRGGVRSGGAGVTFDSAGVISVIPATASTLGGVKQGSNITIASDGTISAANNYVLPVATSSTLGGVRVDDTTIKLNGSSQINVDIAVLQGDGGQLTSVGFRTVPQNFKNSDYSCVLSDSGKHIYHPSGDSARTYTIPSVSQVAYPVGTAITFVNGATTTLSVACGDTMFLAGTATTGVRSIAQNGVATALKVTSATWIISGTGLS